VTHGHTLTTSVAFEEVAKAVAECAFLTSNLPVILSLEVPVTSHPKTCIRALRRLSPHTANEYSPSDPPCMADALLHQATESAGNDDGGASRQRITLCAWRLTRIVRRPTPSRCCVIDAVCWDALVLTAQYEELVATGRATECSPLDFKMRALAKGKIKIKLPKTRKTFFSLRKDTTSAKRSLSQSMSTSGSRPECQNDLAHCGNTLLTVENDDACSTMSHRSSMRSDFASEERVRRSLT
jgi:hypothetical protein